MKKKLLLLSCMLLSQVTFGADPGAHLDGLNKLKILIEQGKSDSSTSESVRIQEHGQDIIAFQAEVLKQSGTIKSMLEGCFSKSLLQDVVTNLVSEDAADYDGKEAPANKALNSERIKLLINALRNNEQNDAAHEFIKNCDMDELAWLTHKAIRWQIDNIGTASAERLLTEIHGLKKEDVLSWGLGKRILDQKVSDRLLQTIHELYEGDVECISSVTFSQDGKKLCVETNQGFYMHNQETSHQKMHLAEDRVNFYSGNFSPDGAQLSIHEKQGVLLHDLVTDSKNIIFSPQADDGCVATNFIEGGKQLCIRTGKRVLVHDLTTQSTRTAFPISSDEKLQEGEFIKAAVFYQDGRQLRIATNRRVFTCDQKTGSSTFLFACHDEETVYQVTFIPGGSKIGIATDKRAVICEQGDSFRSMKTVFSPQNEEMCIENLFFSPDESELYVTTGREMFITGPCLKSVLPCLDGEVVRSAQFGKDGERLYIVTSHRVVIYDRKAGISETIHRSRGLKFFSQNGRFLYVADGQGVVAHDLVSGSSSTVYIDPNEELRRITLSKDESQLCLETDQRIAVLPLLHQELQNLGVEQVNLLLKASVHWDNKQSYKLQESELRVYTSLPEELKRKELFLITQAKEEEASK